MNITEEVLQIMAGQIEALLIEQREGIDRMYHKIGGALRISLVADLSSSTLGVTVDYKLSYPLEPPNEPALKQTVKLHKVINPDQADMGFAGKEGER